MRGRKFKFVIAGVILALALGYLGYRGFMGSATYYYEVAELLSNRSTMVDKSVKVDGNVAPGSVEQKGTSLKFTLTDTKDGQATLPVVYQGAVPDTFKAGNELVVEGKMNSSGVFVAQVLQPKCASRYTATGD